MGLFYFAMKILFIGDVVGRPGRKLLLQELENLKNEYDVDFVNANLENASHGRGLTEKNLKQLLQTPIDSVTMGNHTFGQKEIETYIDNYPQLVRPVNYPKVVPGKGTTVIEKDGIKVGVINISGQIYMNEMDSPFLFIDESLDELKDCDIILVDHHAEATSEKLALGHYLDGKVSAVVGTHTHVQTADEKVLPGGTAYITDLGMTGPENSILGVEKEIIINKFLTRQPRRFEVELKKPWQFNGAVVDIDETTGKARSIERINRIYE